MKIIIKNKLNVQKIAIQFLPKEFSNNNLDIIFDIGTIYNPVLYFYLVVDICDNSRSRKSLGEKILHAEPEPNFLIKGIKSNLVHIKLFSFFVIKIFIKIIFLVFFI